MTLLLVLAWAHTLPEARATVAAPLSCQAKAQSLGAAVTLARACGRRVLVSETVTETEQAFAEPSGGVTVEQSAVPVRARRGAGWVAVDPTLGWLKDGGVGPKATPVDVRLSGGGVGALVRLGLGGGWLSLTWPTALPKPVLAGDTAVYPEVYPEVDLLVRATATGFSHVLVIKSRTAAANPALRVIHFGLTGSGIAVRQRADGGLEAIASDGTRLAVSGGAAMWDSGQPAARAAAVRTGADLGADMPSARSAGELATRVTMPMRWSGGDLALTPDVAMLTSSSTSFPVYVDPSWSATRWRWAYADSANADNNDGVARVGANPDGYGGAYRSFFNFDLLPVQGKHILSAVFRTKLTHSWSCGNSPVSLYWTNAIAGGVNGTRAGWSPGLIEREDEQWGHANKAGGCGTEQPDMLMEFNNGLTGRVRDWVNAGGTDITLGLSTANRSESDITLWKKFSPSDTTLSITYNSIPNVPDQLDTHDQGCATGDGRPVVASGQPTLKARLTDADVETAMAADFSVQRYDPTSSTWSAAWTARTAAISSGATAKVVVGVVLAPGIYRWQALASDAYDTSRSWSPYCEFEVDTVRPNTAVVTADPANTPFVSGKTIRLTLSPGGNPPDTDITGYNWWVVDGKGTHPTAFAAGTTAKIDWTPISGQGTIFIAAKDRVQTSATTAQYAFNAAQPSTEVGRWPLSEPSGSTAFSDKSGAGHMATVSGGGAAGAAGRVVNGDTALALDGASGWAATNGPVVDTSRNFTVSTWVRLTRNNGVQTVLAADGIHSSSFYLQHAGDVDRWSFTVPSTDTDADGWHSVRAVSSSVPAIGVWTLLTGVYDSESGGIRLYVNGVLEGQTSGAHPFTATGSVTIGRAKYNSVPTDYWPGSVYDVRVWDRALSDTEVAAVADPGSQHNIQQDTVAHWLLDEGTGALSVDSSAYAHHLTLTLEPKVGWTPDGHSGSALTFDGTGAARTEGPVLYTDQSFTISAWAKMTGSALPSGVLSVASQDGTNMSGFYLSYRHRNNNPVWCFSILAADSATGRWADACTQTALTTSILNTWVHLAGVYDASTGRLALYINGQRVDDGTGAVAGRWNATGPLTIGRSRWTPPEGGGAKNTDYWVGAIDEVTIRVGTDLQLATAH